MTTDTPPATAPAGRTPRARTAAAVAYFVLAVVGLVGTWSFNLQYFRSGGTNYLGDWFANPASSSVAVDIIVVGVAASVFYVRNQRRLPGRFPWALLFIPLSFAVAVAFAFPLFLGLCELADARRRRPSPAAPLS